MQDVREDLEAVTEAGESLLIRRQKNRLSLLGELAERVRNGLQNKDPEQQAHEMKTLYYYNYYNQDRRKAAFDLYKESLELTHKPNTIPYEDTREIPDSEDKSGFISAYSMIDPSEAKGNTIITKLLSHLLTLIGLTPPPLDILPFMVQLLFLGILPLSVILIPFILFILIK
jgi:hypothetical protein